MIIKQIDVDDGFLKGLSLGFSAGLNVIIGPRGVGKTSIIELIRFGLGVKGYTERFDLSAREHALAVLGNGEITLQLKTRTSVTTVSRNGDDKKPRRTQDFPRPIILSQNEIESVGLHAAGRLRIIDSFRTNVSSELNKSSSLQSQIASLTTEAQGASGEIASLREQIKALTPVPKLLAEAQKEHAAELRKTTRTKAGEKTLKAILAESTSLSVGSSTLERSVTALNNLKARVDAVATSFSGVEAWPKSAGAEDLLEDVRRDVQKAMDALKTASRSINQAVGRIQTLQKTNLGQRAKVDDKVRKTRTELETLQKGLGAITRKLSELQERSGQLSALKSLQNEKLKHLRELQERRGALLAEYDSLLERRFRDRQTVVNMINETLGPRLDVQIERLGSETEAIDAIGTALKGSGLHYNTLAPQLVDVMSPRELIEAIELGDSKAISKLSGISSERADRLVSEIRSYGAAEILTAAAEDAVSMSLLDGAEYKSTEHLSTGQRCTVILPILLCHRDAVLVVDQPEDHLDNAFIVDTLIEAIKRSKSGGQLIFSTHNANIPVLGEADQVIVLGSDGKRGFVRHFAALDDPESVEAISTVMEGGREAFNRRADFYKKRLAH